MSVDIALLARICEAPGAPGFEKKIRELVIAELAGLADEIRTDNMGNVIALKKGHSSTKRCMAAAHMDEIGFIVTHLDDKGFIRFNPVGGFDPKTLTSQRVIIHGRKDVMGVMGSKPVHIMAPEEKTNPLRSRTTSLIPAWQKRTSKNSSPSATSSPDTHPCWNSANAST